MTCVICGNGIPEKMQVCKNCEAKFAPHSDIINAMIAQRPVQYKGIKYGCISAFIIRTRSLARIPIKTSYILQVELMSGTSNSVIIADPKEVKVL